MPRIDSNPNSCPVTRTLGYIGGKWKPLILIFLIERPERFGKLAVLLPISRKILTEQLREMEEDGLILRRSYSEKPPRVEYEITERGKSLIPILDAMKVWGNEIKEDVKRALPATD
ncbi:HxlR family transcriptional regulator [Niastella koreensis]|uniref:Transcriptional regulator, HxlR family n=2 Tax=Niastella koreensis TaxID=354356 RepID=G8TRG8_NIAKG|nr:helix-turn-helix domain-containing protein [Niastella koreensis]AEW01099.1 transcriptional regulator, HxlR family [Niastella koreensis GR20-10]OQP41817.1 HxlR family transcriptional regulator [Niastella koreensis]